MNNRSYSYLCIFVILASFLLICHANEANTHQTITTNLPKLLKLSVQKGDQIKISIFGTNAQYEILFQMDQQQLAVSQEGICFNDQICSLQFKSEWENDGVVIIQVIAYQYSYEIIHNGQEVKREDNVVTSFIGGKFLYSKGLKQDTYYLRVFYESQFIPQITLTFLQTSFPIKANGVNEIGIELQEDTPLYFFSFSFVADGFEQMSQHMFPVTIEIPNNMLKGCNGYNIYDPKIRACPIEDVKIQDTIKINKIGSYPTFELKQQQNVSIKITILEYKKWPNFFDQQFLTVYIGESSDSRAFYGLNKFEIATKFKTKKQCLMSNISCTFTFPLFKGNYTVMPVFPRSDQNSFVYLYERFIGTLRLEGFYSVLPTISDNEKKFYQIGGLMEFKNYEEKLTEITINCKDPFLLAQYMILEGVMSGPSSNTELQVAEFSSDSTFNQDLFNASIFSELQPNRTYLIFFALISQKKFQAAQVLQQQDGQDVIDFQMQDEVGASYHAPQHIEDKKQFFYLQSEYIEVKIKNGKFPHKKLSEKQQQQQPIKQQTQQKQNKQIAEPKRQQIKQQTSEKPKDKQNLSTEVSEDNSNQSQNPQINNINKQEEKPVSSSISTSFLIQILGALVVILILLIIVYLFFLNSAPAAEKDHNELVTQQPSGSITLPDNSIEISQIIKAESSVSQNHQTQMQEYSQSTEKQQEKE